MMFSYSDVRGAERVPKSTHATLFGWVSCVAVWSSLILMLCSLISTRVSHMRVTSGEVDSSLTVRYAET
jgi:hypothetical protein